MTAHVHADYAPPRSWEQFEELCADVFQSAWGDPGLVRHGRAGQKQHGVDIVGRNGSLYPIGLQCKKKATWPVARLTTTDIDNEVIKALKFRPRLKALYVLTTAPDDAALQRHVRLINLRHSKAKLFEVVVLGWAEIVRRATLDPSIADKHFGPVGGNAPRSPLLATWMMSGGSLETSGEEFHLNVMELLQDLHDWPTGHFIIRQQESDRILQELRDYEGRSLTTTKRKERIALRRKLRKFTDAESKAIQGVRLMLTDPEISSWVLKVWEREVSDSVESYINNQLGFERKNDGAGSLYLRMSPPGDSSCRCSALLSNEDVQSIMETAEDNRRRYGKTLTESVGELPSGVRAKIAVPRLIRGILEYQSEDRFSWQQIRQMGALELGRWSVEIA